MILTNANLVDVTRGKVKPNQTIVLKKNLIDSISSASSLSKSSSKSIIDLKNHYLLPGLIDLHVHIAEEPDNQQAKTFKYNESKQESIKRMKRSLKPALLAGVTALRDVGSYDGRGLLAKSFVEKGKIIGPRVFTCGHSLTTPKGHWHERSQQVTDNTDAIKRAVEQEIKQGADFIKIMIEDSGGFSQQTIQAAVATAHKLGKKIAAHAAFPKAIKLAIEAGADTIEHAGNLSPKLIDRVLRQNIIIIPTYFAAYISVIDPEGCLLFDTDASIQGSQKEILKIFKDWLKDLDLGLPKLFNTKVQIGAGTDAGFPLEPFDTVIKEIQYYHKLGLSKLRCLQAATIIAADALDMSNSLGSIKPGMLADLVVVPKNPLQDLSVLEDVKLVIKDGRIYKNQLN